MLLTLPLALPWPLLPAAEASAQLPASGAVSCASGGCHSEIVRHPFVHDPVAQNRCTLCHKPDPQNSSVPAHHAGRVPWALLAAGGRESCRGCHQPEPSFHAAGEDATLDPCLRCHDPHGGATQAELVAPERELCSSCHDRTLELPRSWGSSPDAHAEEPEEITEHGPIREGRCAPCHPAHPENASDLLHGELPRGRYAPYERTVYSACTGSCHSPALIEEETTTTATRFRNGQDNLHYRHVVRPGAGRSCGFCHDPHVADNRALVRRGLPFGKERLTLNFESTQRGGRCATSCHIPVEYDRQEAVPSAMRVRDPAPAKELR